MANIIVTHQGQTGILTLIGSSENRGAEVSSILINRGQEKGRENLMEKIGIVVLEIW